MACSKVDDPDAPQYFGWTRVSKRYATQEECEQDCDSVSGACTDRYGVCQVVKACLCDITRGSSFAGPGTTCNPLP